MPTRDTRLDARAIEQRWPMSAEVRKAVIGRLVKVLADPESKRREVIAAAKALMSAEQQNQSDEHKVIDVQLQFSHDRLSQIADELGIDPRLICDAEAQTGRGIESVSDDESADDERTNDAGGAETSIS